MSIKDKIRRAVYMRRYASSQFWNCTGYIYDALALLKNFVLPDETTGIVLEQYQAIFFYVPKVASTSLIKAFTTIEYGEEMTLEDVPKLKRHDISKYNNYYKFAIVRNPYDRLVSCYYDKILAGGIDFGENINSFNKFAEKICSIPDKRSNMHFKSQCQFLCNRKGNLLMDYVGKFENIEQEYSRICSVIGVQNPPDLVKKNKSDKFNYRKKNGDERISLMAMKRYRKDCALFGYDEDR